MIILRKLGAQQSTCRSVVLSDELQGATDSNNQTFTVSYGYLPGHIEIIYNGQVLTSPDDFEESGDQEITFIYLKPDSSTVLRANYETDDCGTGGSFTFIDLDDTPNSYSGHLNEFVKVNSAGTGLEFASLESNAQEGVTNISNGVSSTAITFSEAFNDSDYVLTLSLENKGDPEPGVYPTLIKNKTASGFTVEFSGDTDSANYYLNWRAGSGYGSFGSGGSSTSSGIASVSEDTTPELGGDLEVDSHLILTDSQPYNSTVSGGYVRGYSGEASTMLVFDNSPPSGDGFATPLYMRSDGKWGTCTAASGTTQMPCMALALEEGNGSKKVFWKGNIRKGEWSWTPNDPIYISTVEGALTNVKPNSGAWPQMIGRAIASDTIRFDPDLSSENPNS